MHMSYEIPESYQPVCFTSLPTEVQTIFHDLSRRAFEFPIRLYSVEAVEAAALLLSEDVKKAVSAHPVLARTFRSNELLATLLNAFSIALAPSYHIETIRYLIEMNPHMLLKDYGSGIESSPLYTLTLDYNKSTLLPWIAERYPWILQNEACQRLPPHLEMMESYLNEHVGLETLRKFYEVYPQGLREKHEDKGYPLSVSLEGPLAPDAEFFFWMAHQYPEAAYFKKNSVSILYTACYALALGEYQCMLSMNAICRFLISEHPTLVRQTTDEGYLPIHTLTTRCHQPMVQEIAVLLLQAYPECVHVMAGAEYPALPTVRFIQQIHPLIRQEIETDEEISELSKASQNISTAAALSIGHESNHAALFSCLFGSLSEVFGSWSNLYICEVLLARKKQIQELITDTCRTLETDYEESDDDESDDEQDDNDDDLIDD
ncbi:hypothetical protein FisN_14Lu332 [Fistulifera solaris]|uniref:Uncharacterized protein n=1 Tax=Fistulifera solaris TaxID=1519565 RepID=A0A1Z5JI29_FISSO|nr:hypothetical protein FisN_14Lu332 [Fistulifera solaris]|eukprot:GAX13657.1 hypothetical protein FisN_14Lu332 [Fistulifera solaris]